VDIVGGGGSLRPVTLHNVHNEKRDPRAVPVYACTEVGAGVGPGTRVTHLAGL